MAICYSYGTQEEPSKKQRTELNWLNSCPICSISSSALARLGSAHVPAICIAVCLNCVNRPKLRISFGFNLELAACLLSRFPTPPSLYLLLPLSVALSIRLSICLFKRFAQQVDSKSKSKSSRVEEVVSFSVPGNFIAIYSHSHSHWHSHSRLVRSPIGDICDVAVTNWLHWLPPGGDPGPVL